MPKQKFDDKKGVKNGQLPLVCEIAGKKHAQQTFQTIDDAMQTYQLATQEKLPSLAKQTVEIDCSHPSESQNNGEVIFIIVALALSGQIT